MTIGKAADSPIYKRVAGLQQPKMPMAPLAPVSEREIVVLKEWIDQGAKQDATAQAATAAAPDGKANASYADYQERVITDEMRQWWAFQKPTRGTHPTSTPPAGRRIRSTGS